MEDKYIYRDKQNITGLTFATENSMRNFIMCPGHTGGPKFFSFNFLDAYIFLYFRRTVA